MTCWFIYQTPDQHKRTNASYRPFMLLIVIISELRLLLVTFTQPSDIITGCYSQLTQEDRLPSARSRKPGPPELSHVQEAFISQKEPGAKGLRQKRSQVWRWKSKVVCTFFIDGGNPVQPLPGRQRGGLIRNTNTHHTFPCVCVCACTPVVLYERD